MRPRLLGLGWLLQVFHDRLFKDWEAALRPLRRVTPLRRLFVLLVDPKRYAMFSFTRWVRKGLALQASGHIGHICFCGGRAWVRISSALEIGFMSEIPGGGLDPDLYAGQYAPVLTQTILNLLQPDAVMIDVGANVGWVALNAAIACPKGRVYAFEPGDFAFAQLRANIERNELGDRIIPIKKALADVTGTMQFTNDPLTHAGNHLVSGRAGAGSTTPVGTVTLDDFITEQNLHRLDLVKCDVEGAELLVLRGARCTIARFRPTFVLEVDSNWLKRFGASPTDVIRFLTSCGYEYRVDRERGEENWVFFPSDKDRKSSVVTRSGSA